MSQFYTYPTSSITATNPSTGTNGSPAPTSSTEVAGIGADGNLHPISVDNTGNQNVNVISSTLPAGGATSALQTTGNTSIASIDTKTPALGQALAAASRPVVLTAAQITALTPLSNVTVTPSAAVLASGTLLAAGVLFTQDCSQYQSASTHLTSLPAGNVVTFQISNDNVNWYSCACMPGGDLTSILTTTATLVGSYTTQLNSRYFRANVTTYTSGTITATAYFKNFGNSPNSVGGYVSALTLDGSGNAVTSTSAALDINLKSSSITVPVSMASTPTGAATAANQATEISSLSTIATNSGTQATSALQTSGNASLTTVATNSSATQGTVAAGVAASKADLIAGQFNTTLPTLLTGQQAAVQVDSSGRLILGTSAATIGTINLAAAQTLATVTAVTSITNALPIGTNTIGAVISAGSAGVSNAPIQNLYGTTNITTAAYVQLVASTTSATNYLDIFDSSGQAMILATGAGGSEVILAYVPPGGDQIRVQIPAATRIAYKALSANATTGYLLVNFWK